MSEIQNIRLKDIKGQKILHPETDDSLVLNKQLETSTTTQNAFELGDDKGNIILKIDDGGNVKTKNFDSTNVYTKDKVYNKEESYSKEETYSQEQVNNKINSEITSQVINKKGIANGFATLDASGTIPTSQLPSYVSDVLEFDNKLSFPQEGEANKIYVARDTNLTYRWSGSAYVEISASLALGETSETAYAGDKGKKNREDINTLSTSINNIKDGTTIDSFKDVEDKLSEKVDNSRIEETLTKDSSNVPTSKAIADYISSQASTGVQSISVNETLIKGGTEGNPSLGLNKDIDSLTNYYKKSDLKEVALSGSYNDLSEKPSIYTQEEINTKLNNKLDKVSSSDVVYGTNSSGEQTTYSKDSFGKVDDVQLDGNSIVKDKIAKLESVIKNDTSNVALELSDENKNIILEIDNNGDIRTKNFDSTLKVVVESTISLDY